MLTWSQENTSLMSDNSYAARLGKVLDYIDAHLGEELGLEQLSQIAGCSKYHFHRQFRHLFGVSTFKYVHLRRLKRAVHELAFRPNRQVLEIALDIAYDGPEAFARAFRKVVGQSPSEFREQPNWNAWLEAYEPIKELRGRHMKTDIRQEQVRIVDFPETSVGALEHRGDPRLLGDTIRRFIEWRKENRLSPKVSATFNIFYNDPESDPDNLKLDLCATTDREIGDNDYGVVAKTIPSGRCAVLRHVGTDESLETAIRYLYADWLPASGEELRDYPLFLQRVTFFPDVPEHEAVKDVFLPLK